MEVCDLMTKFLWQEADGGEVGGAYSRSLVNQRDAIQYIQRGAWVLPLENHGGVVEAALKKLYDL